MKRVLQLRDPVFLSVNDKLPKLCMEFEANGFFNEIVGLKVGLKVFVSNCVFDLSIF